MGKSSCPNSALLGEHLEGMLPAPAEADLVAHLDRCTACQDTLEHLAAGNRPLLAVARQVGEEPPATTPGLRRVLHGLVEEGASAEPDAGPDGGVVALLAPPEGPGELGRLGPYAILEVVGRGGMGVVFKARDEALRRLVAVKVLAPPLAASPSARERFLREARAAAAVRNEHVVAIHAVAEARGLPFLVMEYLTGATLPLCVRRASSAARARLKSVSLTRSTPFSSRMLAGLTSRWMRPWAWAAASPAAACMPIRSTSVTDSGPSRSIFSSSEMPGTYCMTR